MQATRIIKIAVDFDGTLCENRFPEIGNPKQDVIDLVKGLQAKGYKIILWTCRINQPERNYLNEAVGWCALEGIMFDAVNEDPFNTWPRRPRKIEADYYLDDRAVNIKDIKELEELL